MSDNEKADSNSKGKKQAQEAPPLSLTDSLSRLIGVHIAALALAATYLVGVLNGVSTLTALLRASVVGVIFLILGRIAGYMLGRIIESHLSSKVAASLSDGKAAR